MKHLHVAIFLISFQIAWIQAHNDGDEPTTSVDIQETVEGDQQATPSDAQTPTPKSSWYSKLSKPVIDEYDRKLLDAISIDERLSTRSTSRLNSGKSDDRSDNDMFSLRDEDKRYTEDSIGNPKLTEKIKEEADYIPWRKKYWPKTLPHIGSMTPYRFLLETVPENLEYFKPSKERELLYKDCVIVRTWNLFRHGIRYPSKETSHGMRTRLRNLKESILLKVYENPEVFSSTTAINMNTFLTLLISWDVVQELSEGLIYVSNETLNRKKNKAELIKELENLTPLERATREKNKGGADEQIEEAKALTPLGRLEMETMGKRFKERFEYLLMNAELESLLFKFTDCQRTRESATEFYAAIYKRPDQNDHSWHEPIDADDDGKDPLLKFDALCAHWKKNYKKSDLNMHQLDTLITGKYVKNVLNGITDILKFPEKSITFNDGKLFYESCAFEKAWKLESPWCKLMSDKYLSVYEYLEDYEFYKNDGPDNDMNLGVGCFLFNDMVDRLIGDVEKDENGHISWNLHLEKDGTDRGSVQSTEPDETDISNSEISESVSLVNEFSETNSANEKKFKQTDEKAEKPIRNKKPIKKATFYFTHLTAILKFITHLRVHVDTEPLTPYNFEQMKDRKWRIARIGAFGTNISFVLMKCDKSSYILALHQERPLILPNCHEELCPLDTFLRTYQDSIFDCDYEEMCGKYNNRFFSRDMSFYDNGTFKTDFEFSSFSSRSSSGLGSSRRSSFRYTKEI